MKLERRNRKEMQRQLPLLGLAALLVSLAPLSSHAEPGFNVTTKNYHHQDPSSRSSRPNIGNYDRTSIEAIANFKQSAFIAIQAEVKAATFTKTSDGAEAKPITRYFKQVSVDFVKNTDPLVMSCGVYGKAQDFSDAKSNTSPCQDLIPTESSELVESGGNVTRRVVFDSEAEVQTSLVSINFHYL